MPAQNQTNKFTFQEYFQSNKLIIFQRSIYLNFCFDFVWATVNPILETGLWPIWVRARAKRPPIERYGFMNFLKLGYTDQTM